MEKKIYYFSISLKRGELALISFYHESGARNLMNLFKAICYQFIILLVLQNSSGVA